MESYFFPMPNPCGGHITSMLKLLKGTKSLAFSMVFNQVLAHSVTAQISTGLSVPYCMILVTGSPHKITIVCRLK